MKTYLRKIKKIIEEVIGTATVVSSELVINKNWNPTTDDTNNIMRVPSKNFYDYLGHYMCPDEALKDGEGNRGLGIGPYNNDLGLALDKKVFSSPAPIGMEIIYSSEGVIKPFKNIDNPSVDWKLRVETDDVVENYDNRNTTDYAKAGGFVGYYDWQGEWGDIENGFETGVDIQINVSMTTDKVRGGVDGNLIPSGANMTIWIGDAGDVKKSSSYKSQTNTKLFYNQHFSTGANYIGNGSSFTRTYYARINRKPFESRLLINGVGEARGGKYQFISLFARTGNPFGILNLGKIPKPINIDLNFGDRIWRIFQDIFSFLNDFFAMLLGNNGDFYGIVNAEADVVATRIASIDNQEILKHPAYKYFQTPGSFTPISYYAFLYTQFYYPYFNQNPLYAYTDTFNYKKPFLENKVVTSRFANNLTNSDSYISKKYTYFVPSLFCLLFETKIGIFYEQLAKQLKDESGTNNQTNFNIKLENHKTTINPQNHKESQDKCLYDIMFPTNETHWNNYLETTGWTNDSKASDTAFLGNFIDGASVPATIIPRSTFSDYENVFTEYPFLPQTSISQINDVIGDFQQIDGVLKQDIGYDLNTWTALCGSQEFKTLSSGEPKNLAFKLIEFILWYLEPNGIAEQTRLSVNSLLEYEKMLDEDIEDYSNLNTEKTHRDYHIVGTKLYDRTCK